MLHTRLVRFVYLSRALYADTFYSSSRSSRRVDNIPRLHGTVTGFKHRRGYGFVLAEGVVGDIPRHCSVEIKKLMTQYFFTREWLSGGFYVTEGQRVSFDIWERVGAPPLVPKMGNSVRTYGGYVPLEDAPSATAASQEASSELAEDKGTEDRVHTSGTSVPTLHLAKRIRLYDLETGEERLIVPTMLCGKIVQWDPIDCCGVVSELDMKGNFHRDAPRFSLSLDDVDLASGAELRVGRFVRFCLDEPETADSGRDADSAERSGEKGVGALADAGDGSRFTTRVGPLQAARRVIVDKVAERAHGVIGTPLAPITALPGTVSASTRFFGTIRIINDRYGFVTDDLESESIFFHATNVSSRGLHEGDRVSYLLRKLDKGRHSGKKACFDVRRIKHSEDVRGATDSGRGVATAVDDDDVEFDLLD